MQLHPAQALFPCPDAFPHLARQVSEEVDWDLEEGYTSDGQGYVLGAQDEKFANFSTLPMRPDHPNR